MPQLWTSTGRVLVELTAAIKAPILPTGEERRLPFMDPERRRAYEREI
jgi:hypothetical protein